MEQLRRMNEQLSVSRNSEETEGLKSPRCLRRAAMDCLARREHSFFELKLKLQRRFPETDVDEIRQQVERLREENLQSDRRFAEAFVRSKKERGYGFTYIREELRRRFVAENLIDQLLLEEDAEWPDILHKLILRRLPESSVLHYGSRDHQRLFRFLQRRGFPQTLIRTSMSPFLKG